MNAAKPCTHREEHPIRECVSCGCFMRSFHPAVSCDPCGRPEWELTEDEIWGVLARAGSYERRRAVDAVQELVMA